MEFRPKALARFSLTLAGVSVAPLPSAEASGLKGAAAKTPFDPHFVKPTAVDGAQVLPPPPASGALAARADLEAGLPMQAWRAPAQVAWAQRLGQNDPFRFADVLGPWFAKANLPRTTAFMKNVDEDRHEVTEVVKHRFARARPRVVDARVQRSVGKPGDAADPSGRTASIFTRAGVLAEIFPEKRTELFECAHRVVGAHRRRGAFPERSGGRLDVGRAHRRGIEKASGVSRPGGNVPRGDAAFRDETEVGSRRQPPLHSSSLAR